MEYLEWKLKIQIIFGRKIKIRQNVCDKIQILLSSLIDFRRENSNSSVSFFCWSPRIFCSNDALFDLNYTQQRSAKHFRASDPTTFFSGWSLKADTHTVWKSMKMSHFWIQNDVFTKQSLKIEKYGEWQINAI